MCAYFISLIIDPDVRNSYDAASALVIVATSKATFVFRCVG
jgi:hypothetical protein